MGQTPVISSEAGRNPFELAEPVSRRVQIRSLVLLEGHGLRDPDLSLISYKNLRPETLVKEISFARPTDSMRLLVRPSFSMRLVKKEGEAKYEEDSEKSPLTVEASFIITYVLSSTDGLDEENFHAFAGTNGVYNAWPYWREYVSNTVSRMGLPPITLPVFRF